MHPLAQGWSIGQVLAGDDGPRQWLAVTGPAPLAALLQELGLWSLDGPERDFDAEDWVWRCRFDCPVDLARLAELAGLTAPTAAAAVLGLDGLATVCDVSLNGQPLLASSNMFIAHRCPVGHLLRSAGNELLIRCRPLAPLLAQKRPRPRWRVPMLRQQQLRWWRTTLLGRTPGWSPPAAVLGPWRGVWLAAGGAEGADGADGTDGAGAGRAGGAAQVDLTGLVLRPRVQDGHGELGVQLPAAAGKHVQIELARGGQTWTAPLQPADDGSHCGTLLIDSVALWWPHSHGEPALHDATLVIDGRRRPLPPVGFRTLECRSGDGGFQLVVNGVPIFCRGACWTPLDPLRLHAAPQRYDPALAQLRAGGMNMVRISGAMCYEADAFFDACDRHGVLVWQDFMFANMDYPADDAGFVASAQQEVAQQLARWQGRACVAVLCGNSEVEQQAAMCGAPRALWAPVFFHRTLRQWCEQALPDTPYWPSSAHGGALPFAPDSGTASYYGVGAYLRPPADARASGLGFATECLAFAQVPEPSALARMPGGGRAVRVQQPAWKARSPRDLTAGWDFDDVRDHCVAQRFGIDPAALRYADHERYLLLGKVAAAWACADAFSQWRRTGSTCNGALVWFLRDLWAGAGWGLLDDQGQPKAAWHVLARVLQPVALLLTDEGLNGLCLHAVNDTATPVAAVLDVAGWRGDQRLHHASRVLQLAPRATQAVPVPSLFDHFIDIGACYRFGPPPVQALVCTLTAADGRQQPLGQAVHLPAGTSGAALPDPGLQATWRQLGDGSVSLRITTRQLALAVHVDVDGYAADDAYFDLAPGGAHQLLLRPLAAVPRTLRGSVLALNAAAPLLPQAEA